MNEVERARYMLRRARKVSNTHDRRTGQGPTNVSIQSFRDRAPRLPEIFFAVFGEKGREGGLFEKRAALVVRFGEPVDLPLANRNKTESTLTA